MKKIVSVALVIVSMALCAIGGYMYAVRSARLVNATQSGYTIAYGIDDVNEYTYEEG